LGEITTRDGESLEILSDETTDRNSLTWISQFAQNRECPQGRLLHLLMRLLLLLNRVFRKFLIERIDEDVCGRIEAYSTATIQTNPKSAAKWKEEGVKNQQPKDWLTLGDRRRGNMSKTDEHEIAYGAYLVFICDTAKNPVEIFVAVNLAQARV
jgi:hypothetical protein